MLSWEQGTIGGPDSGGLTSLICKNLKIVALERLAQNGWTETDKLGLLRGLLTCSALTPQEAFKTIDSANQNTSF